MKRFLFLIYWMGSILILNAQTGLSKNLWLGTKTPYVPLRQNYTAPPRGFKPVFINYVGRHGARHQTKAGPDIAVLNVLLLASKRQLLTAKGMQLMDMVKTLMLIEKNNYGNISLLGIDEQTEIGTRMFKHYPSVFKGNGIAITTTEEVRTQQSCQTFLKGFDSYNKNNITIKTPPDSLNNELRFYDISPAYLNFKNKGSWRKEITKLEKEIQVDTLCHTIAQLFFGTGFLDSLMAGKIIITDKKGKSAIYNAVDFVTDLNAMYAISYSLKKELANKKSADSAMDFSFFFTDKQLDKLD